MTYTPLFDPRGEHAFDPGRAYRLGDVAEAPRYVYDDPDIELAVNVALAAGRPLLVRGRPGTGKSSLARSVAGLLGWRYYATTVSSRTAARDLEWTFDTVARLADAQAGPDHLRPHDAYVSPEVLWWAFDPARAMAVARVGNPAATERSPINPGAERAVVLVDEIDKADPDVPNDLLLPLGSFRFELDEGPPVEATHPPLVVITTNEERDLPRAFLRRCVILTLRPPVRTRLESIVRSHFPAVDAGLLGRLLDEYERIEADRVARNLQPPSVAELIDAVAACVNLRHPGPSGAAGPSGPQSGMAGPSDGADWPRAAALLLDKATAPAQDV